MADEFLADGLAVRDGFLPSGRVQELIDCAALRRARGEFSAARIGAGHAERREDIRGDSTCWLSAPLYPAEQGLLDDLEALRLEINREAYLGLFDLELHYAWYPPGTGYVRHLDQPNGRAQRQVSVIVYLNPHWTAAEGGALRMFEAGGQHRDIEPLGGRLVYFRCAGCEHAVMPTTVPRLSVSGWFRRRA